MHGLQEGHRDQNRPGNLHQNESTTRKRVVLFCFICRSPYVPFHEKSVCRSPQAVTNANEYKIFSAKNGQSEAETILNGWLPLLLKADKCAIL